MLKSIPIKNYCEKIGENSWSETVTTRNFSLECCVHNFDYVWSENGKIQFKEKGKFYKAIFSVAAIHRYYLPIIIDSQ